MTPLFTFTYLVPTLGFLLCPKAVRDLLCLPLTAFTLSLSLCDLGLALWRAARSGSLSFLLTSYLRMSGSVILTLVPTSKFPQRDVADGRVQVAWGEKCGPDLSLK